ncbi:MAG: hypothetical protein JXC32_00870, partial [Anaerolineae bacterium]|nr:hypothetical protein [Anaerolineae bacterium]
GFVVLFTLIMYFSTRWASRFVQGQISERLDAIDQIVNDEQVPETWLAPYRKRAAKLQEAGATPAQIRALSGIARKRALANIKEMIRFVEQRSLADTETTKQLMLRSFREQQARWEDEGTWHTLVDLTEASPEREAVDAD